MNDLHYNYGNQIFIILLLHWLFSLDCINVSKKLEPQALIILDKEVFLYSIFRVGSIL